MHLTGLRIKNFARFRGEHELELGPGVYALTACYDGDDERSNGLGKTAFLAAIKWLLRGGAVLDKDRIDDLICTGEREMAVDAELSDGSFLSRSKVAGSSVQVFLKLPDGRELLQEDAQRELERLLGLADDDMDTTCFSEQKELSTLLDMKNRATAVFESWTRAENVAEAGDLVASWLNTLSKRHQSESEEVSRLEALAGPDEVAKLEQAIANEEAELERDGEAVAVARKARDQHELRRSLADVMSELAAARLKLEGQVVHACPGAEEMKSLEKASWDASTSARIASEEVDRLKVVASGKFDGACPVSPGFTCPAKSEINSRREKNNAAHEAARAALVKAEASYQAASSAFLKAREERAQADRDQHARAAAEQRVIDLELKLKSERFAGIEPLPLDPADGTYPGPPEVPPPRDPSFLLRCRADLETRKNAAAELEAARLRLRETSDELAAHRLASLVLGPEGLRRRVVEGPVNAVAREASDDLARAGVDLAVVPAWGREVGKPAAQCRECGCPFPTSARVKTCERCGAARGQQVSHAFRFRLESQSAGTSGGNRDVAGLALRVAAFRWLRLRRDAAWSVGLFDEVFGQLDVANTRAVAAGIQRMLTHAFEQVFVTAHDRGVLDAMPNRIRITGYDRWSKVEVA